MFNGLCRDRRIDDRETLALEKARNAKQATVHWQFTCQQARTRLHRLYPSALA